MVLPIDFFGWFVKHAEKKPLNSRPEPVSDKKGGALIGGIKVRSRLLGSGRASFSHDGKKYRQRGARRGGFLVTLESVTFEGSGKPRDSHRALNRFVSLSRSLALRRKGAANGGCEKRTLKCFTLRDSRSLPRSEAALQGQQQHTGESHGGLMTGRVKKCRQFPR